MKIKTVILLVCVICFAFLGACKKKAGPGGKNTISGSVFFKNGATGNNDAAPMATLSIAYGTNESTTTFNQTILTDASGKYRIEGLNKGKYFIKAGYTDAHGFSYSTFGYGIVITNRKTELELNIVLE